jgi:hypothetical protein
MRPPRSPKVLGAAMATPMLQRRDHLQVLRVDARPVLAGVMELHPIGDRPVVLLPHPTMRHHPMTRRPATNHVLAVPAAIDPPAPYPATSGIRRKQRPRLRNPQTEMLRPNTERIATRPPDLEPRQDRAVHLLPQHTMHTSILLRPHNATRIAPAIRLAQPTPALPSDLKTRSPTNKGTQDRRLHRNPPSREDPRIVYRRTAATCRRAGVPT